MGRTPGACLTSTESGHFRARGARRPGRTSPARETPRRDSPLIDGAVLVLQVGCLPEIAEVAVWPEHALLQVAAERLTVEAQHIVIGLAGVLKAHVVGDTDPGAPVVDLLRRRLA